MFEYKNKIYYNISYMYNLIISHKYCLNKTMKRKFFAVWELHFHCAYKGNNLCYYNVYYIIYVKSIKIKIFISKILC